MLYRAIFILLIAFTVVSCQFTETMVLNEDGSGRMSIEMDMGEMMAFSGMVEDSTAARIDTIVSIKDVLEEKKDSISQLSKAEQKKLKRMENFHMRMIMDSEKGEMSINMYTDFKKVEETNDMMDGFENSTSLMPDMGGGMKFDKEDESGDIIGVSYEYRKGKFKRDAYIKDKDKYKIQMDSMQEAEAFMNNMKYKLKYTFPKKIVKSSVEDATYSLDGKTIEFERSFIDYMKNPDVMDLEIETEN